MEWLEFTLAFVLFFASHAVPVRPPVRPVLVGWMGQRGFTLAYSTLSLLVLAWLILATERAPFVPVWTWAPWHSWLAIGLMLVACLFFAFAIGRPNPLSFGGGRDGSFDPTRPGIVRLSRHPLLTVLAIWSAAHLLANGDLAHVILFGVCGLFAGFGGRLIDRRKRRDAPARWAETVTTISLQPRLAPGWAEYRPLRRAAIGIGVWLVVLYAHVFFFGVSPIP